MTRRRNEWEGRRGKTYSTNMFMVLLAVKTLDDPNAKDRRISVYSTGPAASFGSLKGFIRLMLPKWDFNFKAKTIEGYLDQTVTGQKKIRVKIFESEQNIIFSTDTDSFEIQIGGSPRSLDPKVTPTGDLVYHGEPVYMWSLRVPIDSYINQILKDALINCAPNVDGVD